MSDQQVGVYMKEQFITELKEVIDDIFNTDILTVFDYAGLCFVLFGSFSSFFSCSECCSAVFAE